MGLFEGRNGPVGRAVLCAHPRHEHTDGTAMMDDGPGRPSPPYFGYRASYVHHSVAYLRRLPVQFISSLTAWLHQGSAGRGFLLAGRPCIPARVET